MFIVSIIYFSLLLMVWFANHMQKRVLVRLSRTIKRANYNSSTNFSFVTGGGGKQLRVAYHNEMEKGTYAHLVFTCLI